MRNEINAQQWGSAAQAAFLHVLGRKERATSLT
jgi:hypothetical protein